MKLEIGSTVSRGVLAIVASMAVTLLGGGGVMSEGADPGGAEFAKAAIEYRDKADVARETGNAEAATIYDRLAEIKDDAAQLADEGRWEDIDWTEYHELTADLSDLSK